MLDFRVQTFLTVCESMNYTKAAETLHITQPAVSQHIRFLEKEYGVRLFEYHGKKLEMTEGGRTLFRALSRLRNDEAVLKASLRQSAARPRTLSFGVTMTIGEYAIAGPLSRYLKHHPETDVRVRVDNTQKLLTDLQQGIIDFALIEGYFPHERYETMHFRMERFIPVCAADHVFHCPGGKPSTLRDLFGERILIRESGSGTRNILERNLALQNYAVSDFAHFAQIDNMHSIHQLLLEDVGITFLYQIAVAKDIESGRLREIPLTDFDMQHEFTFLWERGSIFDESIRTVCEELRTLDYEVQK